MQSLKLRISKFSGGFFILFLPEKNSEGNLLRQWKKRFNLPFHVNAGSQTCFPYHPNDPNLIPFSTTVEEFQAVFTFAD